MDSLYAWFEPFSTPYGVWVTFGFFVGFILLLSICALTAIIYYLLIGNSTRKYDSLGWWFIFMFIAALLVFLSSAFVIGFYGFENTSVANIQMDIWKFALVNGFIYAPVLYFLLSIGINQLSLHNRHVPINLYPKK